MIIKQSPEIFYNVSLYINLPNILEILIYFIILDIWALKKH